MTGRSLLADARATSTQRKLDAIEKPRLATCSAEHALDALHAGHGRTEFWLIVDPVVEAAPKVAAWFDSWPDDVKQSLTVAARRWMTMRSDRELIGTMATVVRDGKDTICCLTIFHIPAGDVLAARDAPPAVSRRSGSDGANPPADCGSGPPAGFEPPSNPHCAIAGCGE